MEIVKYKLNEKDEKQRRMMIEKKCEMFLHFDCTIIGSGDGLPISSTIAINSQEGGSKSADKLAEILIQN